MTRRGNNNVSSGDKDTKVVSTAAIMPPEDLRPTEASHLTKGPIFVAKCLVQLFSGRALSIRREPPPYDNIKGGSSNKTKKTFHGHLITIAPSHYCEKARWGLDLIESDPDNSFYYTESIHPPLFSSFVTVPASNNQSSAVPMLLFDENGINNTRTTTKKTEKRQDDTNKTINYIYKSDVILQQMCPFLYPKEIKQQTVDLETELGRTLGASIRCFAYHYMLDPKYHKTLARTCTNHCSTVETILFEKMLGNGIDKGMRKLMSINESTASKSAETIRIVFDDMSDRLRLSNTSDSNKDTNNYLMDTKTKSYGFTAVDMTFAALASPLVAPPELVGLISTSNNDLPPEVVDLKEELIATPAGQHILSMYRKHRFDTSVSLTKADTITRIETRGSYQQSLVKQRVVVPKIGRTGVPWAVILAGAAGIGVVTSYFVSRRINKIH